MSIIICEQLHGSFKSSPERVTNLPPTPSV